jgi:hypothetical protein
VASNCGTQNGKGKEKAKAAECRRGRDAVRYKGTTSPASNPSFGQRAAAGLKAGATEATEETGAKGNGTEKSKNAECRRKRDTLRYKGKTSRQPHAHGMSVGHRRMQMWRNISERSDA